MSPKLFGKTLSLLKAKASPPGDHTVENRLEICVTCVVGTLKGIFILVVMDKQGLHLQRPLWLQYFILVSPSIFRDPSSWSQDPDSLVFP